MRAEQPFTEVFYPDKVLRPWVESYILLQHREGGIQQTTPWTVMPDCSGYMIFHLLTNYSRLSLVGPRSVFKDINRKDRVATLIVKFKPWGMSGLLPFPVNDLKDFSIPLQTLFKSKASELKDNLDELARTGNIKQCIKELEAFLTGSLIGDRSIDQRLKFLTDRIAANFGNISVKRLAEEVGISDRYLRKLFLAQIGLSPKRYVMVNRVTNVVRRVDEGNVVSWSDLALSAGYFDQSHMIEEFNNLLGESPEAFISRTNREEIV